MARLQIKLFFDNCVEEIWDYDEAEKTWYDSLFIAQLSTKELLEMEILVAIDHFISTIHGMHP